jgi:hypothetical protein
MATLGVIRDAVKDVIETNIEGLRCYATVPESIELPAVVITPTSARFDVAFGRGTDTWNFDLSVVVSWADSLTSQTQLDEFVTGAGVSSVRQVIFENRTLGRTDCDAHVAEVLQYGTGFSFASINHIGAVLRLIVHTKGTE